MVTVVYKIALEILDVLNYYATVVFEMTIAVFATLKDPVD